MGRRAKLTKRKVRTAIEGTGGDRSLISEACGVNRVSLWRFLNKKGNEDLKELIDQEEAMVTEIGKDHLISKIKAGSWPQIKFWLMTKAKDEFSYRVEQTGKDGGPIEVEQVYDLGNGIKIKF